MRQTQSILFTFLALAFVPMHSFAHGTLDKPASRVYKCYQELRENERKGIGNETVTSDACKEVVAKEKFENNGGGLSLYQWMSILQLPIGDNHQSLVKDGGLCTASRPLYKWFNNKTYIDKGLTPPDWLATDIAPDRNGNFTFSYYGQAPHATKYFKFYVTKYGWDKKQPLKWSDLEEFASVDGVQYPIPPLVIDIPNEETMGHYYMTVKLPPNKTGEHIIYTVWKRSDSEETFYSCSDVNFVGGASGGIFNSPWGIR